MIRKAIESDSQTICNLAKSISVKDIKDSSKGFLVYILPCNEYSARIKISKYFYVSENNDHVDGFLMCYDDETFERMQKDDMLGHEDGITKLINKMPKPYIVADQIGVDLNTHKKGVGAALWNQLMTDMKKSNINTIYAAILQKPTCNEHSIKYHGRIGFVKIDEVKNSDDNVWGIYKYSF